jgi:hypothetical protein
LSLQASAPYDTLKQADRSDKLLHKIITKDKGTFQAGGKTSIINRNVEPLSNGYPYMDPWANPMLVKGVPDDTKQLLQSSRVQKALWVRKNPDKPFVSQTGGNKSSTQANDVFDTMAEANETGGAIQRHLGLNTERFGLSRSMDNRGITSTLPKAPIRASSQLKSTNQTLRVYTHAAMATGVLPSVATGMSTYSAATVESVAEENYGRFSGDEAMDEEEKLMLDRRIEEDIRGSGNFRTLMSPAEILSSDDED